MAHETSVLMVRLNWLEPPCPYNPQSVANFPFCFGQQYFVCEVCSLKLIFQAEELCDKSCLQRCKQFGYEGDLRVSIHLCRKGHKFSVSRTYRYLTFDPIEMFCKAHLFLPFFYETLNAKNKPLVKSKEAKDLQRGGRDKNPRKTFLCSELHKFCGFIRNANAS